MSSIVSGSGTPLVSGSSRTRPPATNARTPVTNTQYSQVDGSLLESLGVAKT